MPRKTPKKTSKIKLPRRSKPWFMSVSLIVGVGLLAGVALFSARYMVSNAEAVPETIVSVPRDEVVFRIFVQVGSTGEWLDYGTRTTNVQLNTNHARYRLTFQSAPSGYTFKQWRFPNGATTTNATVEFSSTEYNNQTVHIDLNSPPSPPPPDPQPDPQPQPQPQPNPQPRPTPQATPPPPAPADTTPPSIPTELTADMPEASTTLRLEWQASSDNTSVSGYRIERSTDGVDWAVLADTENNTTYNDADVQFARTYFYRVAAVDASGNRSDFATTEITTNEFTANASEDDELRVTSGDGIATYIVPDSALDEEALCVVENYLSLGPTLDNYRTVGGPYELTCKNKDGVRITDFNNALAVSVQLPEDQDQKAVEHYGLGSEDWEILTLSTRDEQSRIDIVELGNKNVFIVMAKNKGSSPIGMIVLVLLFVGAVVSGVLFVLSRINRRKQEALYNDYFRKSRGL